MPKRLYFVRHGENVANLTKEFSCRHVDYSLTPKGILQARQTAAHFKSLPVDKIYTSPLKRACQTAEMIAGELRLPVTLLEGLREVNVGSLEKCPPTPENWQIYNSIFSKWYAGNTDLSFPEGENYDMLWGRMQKVLQQVFANPQDKNILIVGHGGMFSITLKEYCPGASLEQIQSMQYQNCSITELEITQDGPDLLGKLVQWGAHHHLSGEAADFVSSLPE